MTRPGRYLRKNWGAPFVITFIVLLFASAVELSFAATGASNAIAIYAFYSLVVGIALQIASYVKYRNIKDDSPDGVVGPPRPPMFSPRTRKLLTVLIIVILVIAAGATAYAYRSTHGFNSLTVNINYINSLAEPAGVVVVAFAITAAGGTPPYNYSAVWPDGVIQSSLTGAFSRTFANQTLPSSVSITVRSTDGQKVTKSVTVPAPSTSSTSSITSTSLVGSTSSTFSPSSGSSSSTTTSNSTVTGKYPPLVVSIGFEKELAEPGGNTTVLFGVSAIGGESPYNFVAVWSDGVVQSNTDGSFSRTFGSGETIPTSAQITVISGDDQRGTVTVTFNSTAS